MSKIWNYSKNSSVVSPNLVNISTISPKSQVVGYYSKRHLGREKIILFGLIFKIVPAFGNICIPKEVNIKLIIPVGSSVNKLRQSPDDFK